MSETAIKFENISKQYRLGIVGTGTIRDDINRWWHTVRGKEDPYLKIGEVNDRSSKANSKYVWALKDINFDIKQGDVVGIIGKNGAGKSTLLKLLSRVTSPTTGCIKAKGRIASLLEVGTGFHPELTGRENIYMNGSIMGMTKAEITSKLDEIIDFAGIEKYIDTPTKRYSSGMTVRLGFAIAAHLEPEILVVDEVLAVGDAEFQKKAIGKMQDVSRGEGKTVLFVSHNMASIKALCDKGIILKDGQIYHPVDNIDTIVNTYLEMNSNDVDNEHWRDRNTDKLTAFFKDIRIGTQRENSNITTNILTGDRVQINLLIQSKEIIIHPKIFLSIYNKDGLLIAHTNTEISLENEIILKEDLNTISCVFDSLPLQIGEYRISLSMNDVYGAKLDYLETAIKLNIEENNIYKSGKLQARHLGMILLPNIWREI